MRLCRAAEWSPLSLSSVTPNLDGHIVSHRLWIRRRPRPSIHPFRSRSRSSFRKMNHSAPPSTPFLSRSLSWVSNYISGERARVSEVGLSLFLCVGRDRRWRFRGMPDMVSERGVDCACPPRDEADDARVIRAATSASPLPPPPAPARVASVSGFPPTQTSKTRSQFSLSLVGSVNNF